MTTLLLALWALTNAAAAAETAPIETAPGQYVTRNGGGAAAASSKTTRLYNDTRLVSETIESPDALIERTYDSGRGVMYETVHSGRKKDGTWTKSLFRRVSTRRSLSPAR